MSERTDITLLLNSLAEGRSRAPEAGREAVDRLLPRVYDELRRLAESQLQQERTDHTLQATALVHEAYLRLVDQTRVVWRSRAHFFAVAAQAIRRILVDHARSHGRAKRGGAAHKLSLDDALTLSAATSGTDLLALDEVLDKFSREHADQARVVEMRFFGGLTTEEAAAVLGVTTRTVERYWEFARAWLYRELESSRSTERPGY